MTQGVLRTLDETERLKSDIVNYMITTPACTLTQAANACGVAHGVVYAWQSADTEFKSAVTWARRITRELTNDFVESRLIKLIKEGNAAATIFYAKCRMKDRGYNEKMLTAEDVPPPTDVLEEMPTLEDAMLAYRSEQAPR